MFKKILAALLMVVLFAVPAFGVGTCVQTTKTSYTAQDRVPDSFTVIVTLTCTAGAADHLFPSTVIALTPSTAVSNPWNLFGYYLYQVGRTPGVVQPTGNYTVTITDTRGFAIDLALLTSNGSASVPQLTMIANTATDFPVVRSALTVAISATTVNSANIILDLIFKAQ